MATSPAKQPLSRAQTVQAKLGGGGDPCVLCGKRCYQAEAMRTNNNNLYHKECFRCSKCQCKLSHAAYREDAHSKRLYCNAHYQQLAKSAGLDKVAKGGVDVTAGVLIEEKKKEEELEESERVGVGSAVWVSVDDIAEPQRKVALGGAAPDESSEPYVRGVVVAPRDGAWGFTVDVSGRQLMAPKKAVSLAEAEGAPSVADNLQLAHMTEVAATPQMAGCPADGPPRLPP